MSRLHRCAAHVLSAFGLFRLRQSRILEHARKRERGRVRNEGRTRAAASLSGLSTPPAVPARRVLLEKHVTNVFDGLPRPGPPRPDCVDADIDVPVLCIQIAEPTLKTWTRGVRYGHDALGRVSSAIGLEKHRNTVGRFVPVLRNRSGASRSIETKASSVLGQSHGAGERHRTIDAGDICLDAIRISVAEACKRRSASARR